ncbi:insulin receptor substrate 1-like [Stegostoma tigrinum]|uniref:insulin receptor substrate 1-like n=1 Tax=Stegostoma tigrinum TaxID=3053191 RepID=UPI00286FC2BD|nr:insulin receptor substrate 1-like [Stegostoma tigrinum]
MAEPSPESDVRKCGVLRKWKSLHRRYCVLRADSDSGPARLELYDSEKKFRSRGAGPRRALPLSACFTVNKRRDARSRYLLCVYTRSESVCLAAAGPEEQESWYRALTLLLGKSHVENGDSNYTMVPGPPFKEVWQVNLRPRGLGQTRNMSGIYRLCLTDKTVNLVKLNSDAAAVVLQLMNIRRCGHSENFFFVEVGRSAVTGPGEFWMQVDDSVLAQNMHETILDAMKAMSEEFRLRSKSQSSGSNPISVPSRRHHQLPSNPPPSRVGFTMRRGVPTSPGQRSSFARARTPSDGSGAASSSSSRPPSADESPSSPPPRQGTPGAQPPPVPSRSISDPASSPLGLPHGGFSSSSSLPSSSPSSCSSSDGEGYESSPGSPAAGGRSPLHDYVAMGCGLGLAGHRQSQCQRRLLRRAGSRGEEEEEADRGLSKQAWPARVLPEPTERGHSQAADQGYVAMLPGVVPPGDGDDNDYMAMTPKGPSAPRRIESPGSAALTGGYVLMSPSGSCSPDGWARPLGGGSGMGGVGGDYMNMSPASCSASSTTPSCHQRCTPRPRKVGPTPPDHHPHCYHSLPRSYKQLDPALSAASGHLIASSSSGCLAPCTSGHFAPSSSTSSSSPGRLAPSSSSGRLTLSSSSSTGSSESLTEVESGQHLTCRQPGPSLDLVRATTLPRRRECSLPAEPQSPGEYVSIEFRAPPGTACSPAGLAPSVGGPRVTLSEYINMDFRPEAHPPLGLVKSSRGAPAQTRRRLGSPVPGDSACPLVAALPEVALDSTEEAGPGPHSGVRGICAEPQRRRRHCSETLLTTPHDSGPSAPCSHLPRRRGSTSFEGADDGDVATEAPCAGMSRHMSIGFENGLNYIDLDLGTDSVCADMCASQPRLYTQTNGSGTLNTYASIDFHKSEELRSHKRNKDDC